MKYSVRITSAAWRDLEEIHEWIAENDSPEKADYVLDRLTEVAAALSSLPNRGSRVRELPRSMDQEFRQLYFKPYRVVYEIMRNEVVIHLIADGRRKLRSLVLRRLTGG